MEDISKISVALLDLEKGLSTLQEAVNKIEQAKDTAVLAVENTKEIQNSFDIVVKRVIHLVNEFQSLDIPINMKRIESSIDTLNIGLQQATDSITKLDDSFEEKWKRQTADFERGMIASTSEIKENFAALEVDLQQTTDLIRSLNIGLIEKINKQTAYLAKGMKATTNKLADRIEKESKSNLNIIVDKIDSQVSQQKTFQIAQLIISVATIILVIILFFL